MIIFCVNEEAVILDVYGKYGVRTLLILNDFVNINL